MRYQKFWSIGNKKIHFKIGVILGNGVVNERLSQSGKRKELSLYYPSIFVKKYENITN
jgi:hypothetical protein